MELTGSMVDPILNSRYSVFRVMLSAHFQVVTVAKFQGEGAYNVIPDSVTIGGTFRAFSKESFMHLKQRIEEVQHFTPYLAM